MSHHPETCFECGRGRYVEVVEDYRRLLPDGESLIVPKLLILRCDKCGGETLPPESSRRIETAVDQHHDTLSPAVVRAFLEQFQIDQTEAAEALGMGGKTLHRWARGTQRVSRSMGYFLRALMAHPDVYEWIRDRRWRQPGPKAGAAPAPNRERAPMILSETPAPYKIRRKQTGKYLPQKARKMARKAHGIGGM